MPLLSTQVSSVHPDLVRAANSFIDQGGKLPAPQDQIRVTRKEFYHRQAIPDAGSTSLEYFSAAQQRGVCNMPGQGNLPSDQLFVLTGFRAYITSGMTIAGAAAAAGAQGIFTIGAATTGSPANVFENVKNLLQHGLLTVSVGSAEIIEGLGLDKFPSGRGVDGFAASSTLGGAEGEGATVVSINNGSPMLANIYGVPPYPIYNGAVLRAKVEWLTAIDIIDSAGILLTLEACGTLFRKVNSVT